MILIMGKSTKGIHQKMNRIGIKEEELAKTGCFSSSRLMKFQVLLGKSTISILWIAEQSAIAKLRRTRVYSFMRESRLH